MASADFCIITAPIAEPRAIGFHRVRSSQAMDSEKPRHLLTRALLVTVPIAGDTEIPG